MISWMILNPMTDTILDQIVEAEIIFKMMIMETEDTSEIDIIPEKDQQAETDREVDLH